MNEFGDILEAIAHAPIAKRAITNRGVLNEAHSYAKPSLFSRGMRIEIGSVAILLISGTASIDENGKSVHIGDFPAQLRRTFENITGLLTSEGARWHDVVRTTCYLRDIERDYKVFNACERRFSKSRGSILCPHRQAFRRFCAGLSCSSKSKRSQCFGRIRQAAAGSSDWVLRRSV